MGNKPTEKKIKVMLGMPATEMMKAKTAHAIACLTIQNPYVVDFLMMQSCDISSARTWLVKQAIAKEATHILFIDSDMMFPPDALHQLLAHEKDIIGVEYNKRKFPLETVTAYMSDVERSEDQPYKVGVAGTGIMLINLDVFKNPNLDKNWFSFGRNAEGEHVMGEDGWFCNQARAAGYDVWVDPTIKVLHLGEFGY